MSNINFRIYGDQIYANTSKFIDNYLTIKIVKEEFNEKFKEGTLNYDNIQTKQKINITSQITIDKLDIQKLLVNIPQEKENLKLYLDGVKCILTISHPSEKIIEELLINERKNLIEKFINSSADRVQNKQPSKSFTDNLIEKFINNALNGLYVSINKLELQIKCNANIFILNIDNFVYDQKKGIILKNISLLYDESFTKSIVIQKFNINIFFKNFVDDNENKENKENQNKKNEIEMNMSSFSFELTKKIYNGISEIISCFTETSYKKTYVKYKNLIQFHRPKNNDTNTNKKNYKLLWLYAIRTVIKLQKYIGYDKQNIFDLLNSTQENIGKKYLNKDKNFNDIFLLYPSEINLLKSAKESVNKKVLDDKKGNVLTNAFSFFFGGGGGNEKKNELTEEEKNNLEKIFTTEEIIKFLIDYNKLYSDDNFIIAKIKKIFLNIVVFISIQKLELILVNENNPEKCNLYIQNINFGFNHQMNDYECKLFINDIFIKKGISIFKNRIPNRNNMIEFSKNKNNNIQILFGFNNIELDETNFIFVLVFLCSINTQNKTRLFQEKKYDINKKEEAETKNDDKNINDNGDESLLKHFSINQVPSLKLNSKENNIEINFTDFLLADSYFCFTLNIKDSFGEILPDYTFMISTIKENNKFKFHQSMPIKLTFSKETSKFTFLSYLKYEKIKNDKMNTKSSNNIITIVDNNDKELFGFKYTSHKQIKAKDFNIAGFDLFFDKTEIEINEEKCKSVLLIDNFSIVYENKNLNINIGKIYLSTDKYSTITLYLFTFESPDYKDYLKLLNNEANKNNPNNIISLIDTNQNSSNKNQNTNLNNDNNSAVIESEVDICYILRELFKSFNININLLNFIYKADNNITSLIVKNIKAEKKNISFFVYLSSCKMSLNMLVPVKHTSTISKATKDNIETVLDIKQKTVIETSLITGIINVKIINPLMDINMSIVEAIIDSYKFLIDQINLEVILCQLILNLENTKLFFDQFIYYITNVSLINFSDNKNEPNDTIYVKINDFVMKSQSDIEIIKEKELDVDYKFKSSEEHIITMKSFGCNINLTQNDICDLLLSIKTEPKKKESPNENNISKKNENNNNNNSNVKNLFDNSFDFIHQMNNNIKVNLNDNNLLDELNINNNIDSNTNTNADTDIQNAYTVNNTMVCNNFFNDNSFFNVLQNNNNNLSDNKKNNSDSYKSNNKKTKITFTLTTNMTISSINLCLCLNDYTKISEFSITSSIAEIDSLTKEAMLDKTITNEINYKIFLGQLLLKYFDSNNNEIIMLNYEKEAIDQKNKRKNMDKKKANQVEIMYNNNEINVNINKNEVILRADSFLAIYYYFKGSIPINELIDNFYQAEPKIEKANKSRQIQINFKESKFQLQTSYDGNENLHLDINSFVILYNSLEDGLFPYGNLCVTLNTISTTLISKNHSRKLFYTSYDFLSVKLKNDKLKTNLSVVVDSLFINLSYSDIISFLRAYFLNLTFYTNEKKNSKDRFLKNLQENLKMSTCNIKETVKIIPLENSIKEFSAHFKYQKLDITLVDNSSGSYYPFMNLNLNKILFTLDPKKNIELSMALILYSYNYIACVWEPIIENVHLSLKYIFRNDFMSNSHKFSFDINTLSINLSDMSISFTLVSLNNWLKKFILEEQEYQENKVTIINNNLIQFKSESSINNISKITNNKVINHSGVEIFFKYANKDFSLKPSEEIALEYINKWEFSLYGPKQILLVHDKVNFSIPIEKIVTLKHDINSNFFFVSENTLSKDRQINITIYSPIIFKNKSALSLVLKLNNPEIGDLILPFDIDCILGVPFNFYKKKTTFSFQLKNNNKENKIKDENNINTDSEMNTLFNLNEIVCNTEERSYKKNIFLQNQKILCMKMKKQITNIRTILITSEYSIINCLPCDILMETRGRGFQIQKCSQLFIDFYSESDLEIFFKIFADGETFFTKKKKIFELPLKKEGNYLKFRNSTNTQSFRLLLDFKESTTGKTIIIYAESIIHNVSGVSFELHSKNKTTNTNLCFSINDNLYLISSKVDNNIKESYFQLSNNIFVSKKITLQEVMKASPYLKLSMTTTYINEKTHEHDNYELVLLIKRRMSYLTVTNNPNFKENMMTIIYCILPICRVTNMLPKKNFIIQDSTDSSKFILIPPMKQIDFNFFNRGLKSKLKFGLMDLKESSISQSQINIEFTYENFGIYTFCIGKDMFNLEIRESSSDGIIDMFIIETTLENGKILVENLTDSILNIYQIGYEKFPQIVNYHDKQILHVYDQLKPVFIFEIGAKASTFEFNSFEEEQSNIEIDKNIILFKESNGIKMNLTFYKIDVFNQLESKLTNIFFNIKINTIYISMIGDNEDKNKRLNDYKRHEIMLLVLTNLAANISWEKNLGLLGKDIITMNGVLEKLGLYNQISEIGKYSCALSNITAPFMSLFTEMFYFKNGRVAKINKFIYQMGKIILNIDPVFITEILNFFQNIIYRMKISNFNVDPVFLSSIDSDEDKEDDIYNPNRILCYGNNFDLPPLKIDFELSNIGLNNLLKEKLGCSSFFIWLAKGLSERKTSVRLTKFNIPYFIGKLNGMIKTVYSMYKAKIVAEITSIGLKGLIGNVTKIFFFISNDKNCTDVQLHRLRIPRAFYDKYKYFKTFNINDATYFAKIEAKYPEFQIKYHCINLIKSKSYIFVFTSISLFIMNTDFQIFGNIFYANVSKSVPDKSNLVIHYNKAFKGKDSCNINCEDNATCAKVSKYLNNETNKNTDRKYL